MEDEHCYSCDAFEGRMKPVGPNNNTYNENDASGTILLIRCFIICVGLLSGLVSPYFWSHGISILTISLLVIVTTTCMRRPISIVHAASAIVGSSVRTPPVLDAHKLFSGAVEFEEKFVELKEEIMQLEEGSIPLTRSTFDGENEYIGQDVRTEEDGKEIGWRVFTVCVGPHISEKARTACPTLVRLLEKYSAEVKSCAISILPSHTKIPQHVGYYKGVIRYMLPIKVPVDRENVYICVNKTKIVWEEGKSVMFDDTYPHKVFNRTDEHRIVIYMDIIRPLSSWWLNMLNAFMIRLTQNAPTMLAEIKKTEQITSIIPRSTF